MTQKTSPTLQSVKVDVEGSLQGSVKLNGLAERIVVRRLDNQKTLAYVALGKRGLHILNVTDIENIIVNQNPTGITEASDIVLDENNWLYVSDEYIGLHVFEDAKNLTDLGGVVYAGNPKILKKICPGEYGTIRPIGYCMIGKR